MPKESWDEQTIELFLQDLSLMDSNNFLGMLWIVTVRLQIIGTYIKRESVLCPIRSKQHTKFNWEIAIISNTIVDPLLSSSWTLLYRLNLFVCCENCCCCFQSSHVQNVFLNYLENPTIINTLCGMNFAFSLLLTLIFYSMSKKMWVLVKEKEEFFHD
jgi:hypothetical protein